MDTLMQDLRYAFRSLTARPAVFAVAALSLALGISANTTIFAALDAFLIQPLPYPDASRLAQIWTTNPSRGWRRASSSVPDFLDWRRESRTMELAAITSGSYNMMAGDRPERVSGAHVTPGFFHIMGVRPASGRWFLDEEGQTGRATAIVFSDAFWRRRFASDPSIIGKSLQLDGASYTVVGIMPADFQFPYRGVDIWVPLAFDGKELRASRYLSIIGRVRSGVSLSAAERELSSISANLAKTFPDDAGIGVRILRLDHALYDDTFRLGATVSTIAVAFVLLIACANVANILLARATARSRELALRIALGAGRSRLVRQLMTESIVLALVGGVVGTGLSVWGVRGMRTIIPSVVARSENLTLNGRALLFTFALAVVCGLIFGTAPALQATKSDMNGALREGGRGGTLGLRRNRLGASLVVAEIALALSLLVSAGLLIKSAIKMQMVDLGFDAQSVLTMAVALPTAQYPDSEKVINAESRLLEQLRELPGVRAAGAVTALPFEGGNGTIYAIEGEPRPQPGKELITQFRAITPQYLATMKIAVVKGRDVSELDRIGSTPTVLVNEAFVRRHWPSGDPLGKRVIVGVGGPNELMREVVGVVKDTREFGPDTDAPATIFIPALQRGTRTLTYVMRTDVPPASLSSAVRDVLRGVDPTLPGYAIRTLDEVVQTNEAGDKIMSRLLGIFGAAALLLAIIGVYGVMSYSVSQRTREVGVRMALGAQRRDIMGLVVGQGALLSGIGLAIGLACAGASTKALNAFLVGVSPYDIAIYSGVTIALGLAAVVASLIPALRAIRVDPLVALRDE